jgi:hypothetical protein
MTQALRAEIDSWRGHLGVQSRHFQEWMQQHLTAELADINVLATPTGQELIAKAETRFRRITEAFRDRLARNLSRTLNVTLSPLNWDVRTPHVTAPDTRISKTFDTNWELLWWAIPMPLFGWLFRRHCIGLIPWEVEKNMHRLVSDWHDSVAKGMNDLRNQAIAWVRAELDTLSQLLTRQLDEVPMLDDYRRRLHEELLRMQQTSSGETARTTSS